MDEGFVRQVQEADIPRVAERMGRAFAPQPLTSWLLGPGQPHRAARLMALELRRALPYHMSYTTGELQGAAVWFPPERKINLWKDVWYGLRAGLVIGIGLRSPLQLWMGLRLLLAEPDEPSYYLSLLAVAPEWQGQGVGSALLRPGLARCDAERMPAYLSTDTSENVRFYQRHGFRVSKAFPVPGSSFYMYVMVRPSEPI